MPTINVAYVGTSTDLDDYCEGCGYTGKDPQGNDETKTQFFIRHRRKTAGEIVHSLRVNKSAEAARQSALGSPPPTFA